MSKGKFETTVRENLDKLYKDGFVNVRKGLNLATMQPSDNTRSTGIVETNIRIYD